MAESKNEYEAAIRFREKAWAENDKADIYFRSKLESANAIDEIALGRYARARAALQVSFRPYAAYDSSRAPILARGLALPLLTDNVRELKAAGGVYMGSHPNPCTDDRALALYHAARGSFAAAKRILLKGFAREGCFLAERARYLPYLAAVCLSESERDAGLLWLYRSLRFRVPMGDLSGLSHSAIVAAHILASAQDRDLDIVRAYILSGA